MRVTPPVVRELESSPDLVSLISAARDAGLETMLLERPMPDAVSIAGLGRQYDLVSTTAGVALEAADGTRLDEERGPRRLDAASRLWQRFTAGQADDDALPGTGLVAVGGFAFDPDREPQEPWLGFPSLLFRVPQLAVTRVRGRTFLSGDESLLECRPSAQAPPARRLTVESERSPESWSAAVAEASHRLQAGEAAKVVLARQVFAHADGVLSAGAVLRSLRASYPACYIYLVSGADGTALAGASPELLIRRTGTRAVSQPMAGSIARGRNEAEDERLARALRASGKDSEEHRITARYVHQALTRFGEQVERRPPEVVRLTNIQHLATEVRAWLPEPRPTLLELAAALHPTPAVNGYPAAAARELLAGLEKMERGWYAGAVGWLDSRGDGELAVAIRCGLLDGDGARLYAGVGIMPLSEPAAELAETELKLRALLGAISA